MAVSRSGLFLARLWDDAVGPPAFLKELIFSGAACRGLHGGALEVRAEEDIDCCFTVRRRLMRNQMY